MKILAAAWLLLDAAHDLYKVARAEWRRRKEPRR